MKKGFWILRQAAGGLLALLLASCGGLEKTSSEQPFSHSWEFEVASAYAYDAARLEIAGGAAVLRPLVLAVDAREAYTSGIARGIHLTSEGAEPERSPWPDATVLLPDRAAHLLGEWRMNEAAWNGTAGEVTDSSGNGHHGVREGSANTVARRQAIDRAGLFDGSGDAVRIAMSGTLNGDFTLSLWFDPATIDGTTRQYLAAFTLAGNVKLALGYSGTFDDGTIRPGSLFLIDGNGQVTATAGNVLSQAGNAWRWNHLLIAHDAQGTRMLLNGRPVVMATDGIDAQFGFDTFWLARRPDTGDDYAGTLDDAALWNSALTPEESHYLYLRSSARVTGLLTSTPIDAGCQTATWPALEWHTNLPFGKGLPGSQGSESSADYPDLVGSTGQPGDDDLMTGLIALWHLDEAPAGPIPDGFQFADASGNGHPATAINPNGNLHSVPGRMGRALHSIHQKSDYLITDLYLDNPQGTLSVWIRTDDAGRPFNLLAAAGTHDGSHRFYIGISGQDKVIAGYGDTYVDHSRPIVDRRWYHLVLTGDGSTARVYVDGAEFFTFSYHYPAGSSSDPFLIGAKTYKGDIPGDTFQGLVDEVAIWDHPLNPDEIRQLYQRGANRVGIGLRTCSLPDCSDRAGEAGEGWFGPLKEAAEVFTEEQNNTLLDATGHGVGTARPAFPYLSLASLMPEVPAGRYLQWRAWLVSDDEQALCGGVSCVPELRAISFQPRSGDSAGGAWMARYACGGTEIHPGEPVPFRRLTMFEESGSGACERRYQLSNDGGDHWFYFDGERWKSAADSSATASTAAEIGAGLPLFPTGEGNLNFRAYLISDGTERCTLDRVRVSGWR